jgi:hypothetical protein
MLADVNNEMREEEAKVQIREQVYEVLYHNRKK